MTVEEWMLRNGLTLTSEIPTTCNGEEVVVPEELLEGLSEEHRRIAEVVAKDSGRLDIAKAIIGWMKAGDVPMFNDGITPDEAIRKTQLDFNVLRNREGLVPSEPFEYLSYQYSLVGYIVAFRFKKVNKE